MMKNKEIFWSDSAFSRYSSVKIVVFHDEPIFFANFYLFWSKSYNPETHPFQNTTIQTSILDTHGINRQEQKRFQSVEHAFGHYYFFALGRDLTLTHQCVIF